MLYEYLACMVVGYGIRYFKVDAIIYEQIKKSIKEKKEKKGGKTSV